MAPRNPLAQARAMMKRARTLELKAARGVAPGMRRSSDEVCAEQTRRGRPTVDDAFGGVPSYHRFAEELSPLYRSRDGRLLLYFPGKDGIRVGGAPRIVWWRTSTAVADPPAKDERLRATLRAEDRSDAGNDVAAMELVVTAPPKGNWRKGGGSIRTCTGQVEMIVTSLP
jgi:hypothetical protein